jgi:hypothetical protein
MRASAIHIVISAKGAAQTSERRATIAPVLGMKTVTWDGLFEAEPKARTRLHTKINRSKLNRFDGLSCAAQRHHSNAQATSGRKPDVLLGQQDNRRP